MTVTIRQLHPHFFGEVSGVDLRKPLTPQEAADIEAGMDKYAVLLFPGQDITDQQQMAFALNFGERENPRGGNVVKPEDVVRVSVRVNDRIEARRACAEDLRAEVRGRVNDDVAVQITEQN